MTTLPRLSTLLAVACLAGCARGRHDPAPVGPVSIEMKVATSAPIPGTTPMLPANADHPVWVFPEVVVNLDDVDRASVSEDALGRPAIVLDLNERAAARLLEVSTRHLNEPLAIFVDGELVSAPYIRSPVSSRIMIMRDPDGIDPDLAASIVARVNAR